MICTHTRLTAFFPGLPGWAGTRKVKPIWILLKQETVSGSGISWAICKSAPRSRQTTTPAPHHSVFYDRMPFLLPNQQRQSTEGTILWSALSDIMTASVIQISWCVTLFPSSAIFWMFEFSKTRAFRLYGKNFGTLRTHLVAVIVAEIIMQQRSCICQSVFLFVRSF